jgi:hypothetical protein
MATLYGSRDWQVVSAEVTKEIQLEFKQDVPITPSLEEGGQAGNPFRLGFHILANRILHLSMSLDLETVAAQKVSYVTGLTYYTKLAQAVPNKIELGERGWSLGSPADSPALEKLSSNRDLFEACRAFAGGEYELPTSKLFRSNKKIRMGKLFQIVPHESTSLIMANTLPTDAGGLLKVSEFIDLADSIEQAL